MVLHFFQEKWKAVRRTIEIQDKFLGNHFDAKEHIKEKKIRHNYFNLSLMFVYIAENGKVIRANSHVLHRF